MKSIADIIAMCFCLGASLTVSVSADQAASAQRAIQLQYSKVDAAAARKDLDGALACYAPDYVTIDLKGQSHSLADVRQTIQNAFSSVDSIKSASKIRSISVKGNGATVLLKQHIVLTRKNSQTGQLETQKIDETDRDYWVATKTSWLLKRTRALS